MSIISLYYGQCGNQIGSLFYSKIYEDLNTNLNNDLYHTQSVNRWFNVTKSGKWEPKSVLIDTEQKVVNGSCFQFKNIVAKSLGGSANNWAYGYTSRSRLLMDDIMNNVRLEMEKSDFLSSILNIFSSSGGTGSGVGTCVVETLRDEYPNKIITNAVILPYQNGDVVTQSYNNLLALSKLYSLSDSFLMFENDRLHYICNNSLNISNVNFCDINSVIALQLASVFYPLKGDFQHFLPNLCVHPSFKLLQIKNSPYSPLENGQNWKHLLNSITKTSRFDRQQSLQLKLKNVAAVLICRGAQSPNNQELKPLFDPNFFVNWLPQEEVFKICHQSNKIFKLNNNLTLVSNSNKIVGPLNQILEDAWNLFCNSAYLHHYKKFGFDKEYFLDCFRKMEQVLVDYKMNSWSIDDKKRFLVALGKVGSKNLSAIQTEMPEKTISEIRYVVEKYTKCAYNRWHQLEKEKNLDSPINQWIKIFKKTNTQNGVIDIVPRVLKYIALFEKRPTDEISLRDCYMALSESSNGNTFKNLDNKTNYFLFKSLSKLAQSLKYENLDKKKKFVASIKNMNRNQTTKTFKKENVILNPLNVPKELLRKN